MGAWSSTLYGNDATEDVRDIYKEFLEKQYSNQEAYEKTYAECEEYIGDDDEPLFWYALADTQWRYGRLMPEVKEKALWWIEHDGGMFMWEESKNGGKGWRKTLDKLKEKLNSEMPAEKKFRVPQKFVTNPWNVGDMYAYKLHSKEAEKYGFYDKYMVMQKVGNGAIFKDEWYSVVQVYDKIFDSIPTVEMVSGVRILPLVDPYGEDGTRMRKEDYWPSFERYFQCMMRAYKKSYYPKAYMYYVGTTHISERTYGLLDAVETNWGQEEMEEDILIQPYLDWHDYEY